MSDTWVNEILTSRVNDKIIVTSKSERNMISLVLLRISLTQLQLYIS